MYLRIKLFLSVLFAMAAVMPAAKLWAAAPPVPAQLYPAAQVSNPRIDFVWQAVSDPDGIVSYTLEVSAYSDFSILLFSHVLSNPGYALGAAESLPALYYWRVRVLDGAGESSLSSGVRVDVLPKQVRYRFQRAEDSTFTINAIRVDDLTSPSYTTALGNALAEGTTYYWTVVARDAAGNQTPATQPAWSLALQDIYGPSASAITYPASDDQPLINDDVTLIWAASSDPSGVASYRLEVSDYSNFSMTRTDVNTPQTSYGLGLLPRGHTYYARVTAIDNAGNPTVGPTRRFVVASKVVTYRLQVDDQALQTVLGVADIASTSYQLADPNLLSIGQSYRWHVFAQDPAKNEREALQSWTFSIADIYPPVKAIPVYPLAGAAVLNPNPVLAWQSSSDAVSYDVKVSISSTFVPGFEVASATTTTPSLALTGLTRGATYYWQVVSYDAQGNSSASDVFDFTVRARDIRYQLEVATDNTFALPIVDYKDLTQPQATVRSVDELPVAVQLYWRVTAQDEAKNQTTSGVWGLKLADQYPPPATSLIYPRPGAHMINPQFVFDWQDVPDTGPVQYRIELSANAAFSPLISSNTVAVSSFQPATPLVANQTYYWRVIAIDQQARESTAASASFFLQRKAVEYDFYVFSSGGSHEQAMDLTQTSYSLGSDNPLTEGVTYSWTVTAKDAAGNQQSVGPWTLALADNYPPLPPQHLYPRDGDQLINVSPCFSWGPAQDVTAITYTIQISYDAGFNSLVETAGSITDANRGYCLALAGGLSPGVTYYWRIWSEDATANGAYSQPTRFTVQAKKLSYSIQVATDIAFSMVHMEQKDIIGETFTLPAWQQLSEGVLYYWRVAVQDLAGNQANSSSTFSLQLADIFPPTEVVVLYPKEQDHLANPQVTLSWASSFDPSAPIVYHLQVATTSQFFASTIVLDASNLAQTSAQIPVLPRDITYYYRISPSDASGNTRIGSVHSFVVAKREVSYDFQLRDQNNSPIFNAQFLPQAQFTLDNPGLLQDGQTYHWLVSAVDAANNARQSSSTFSFYLSDQFAPPLPQLRYPRQGATIINPAVGFVWDAVSDPNGVRYTLEIDDLGTFAAPLYRISASQPQYQLQPSMGETLALDKTYYWRVVVEDNLGNSAATEPLSFDLKKKQVIYTFDAREQATNLVRAYQETTSTQWTNTDPLTFDVATTYSWRVAARDQAGNSIDSAVWTFSLADIYPPPQPQLFYPKADASLINPQVGFLWQAVTDSQGVTYGLQISEQPNFAVLTADITGLANPNYQLPAGQGLVRGKTYYWRVTVVDGTGYADVTTARSFAVADKTVSYNVQIAQVDGTADPFSASTIVDIGDIVTTQHTLEPAYATIIHEEVDYLWRIVARDGAGSQRVSSQQFAFRILDTFAPPLPALVFPADRAQIINAQLGFLWLATHDVANNGELYDLQVSTDPGFATLLIDQPNLVLAHYQTLNSQRLMRGQTYYWRVSVHDSLGNAATTPVQSFFVQPKQVHYALDLATDGGLTNIVYRKKDIVVTSDILDAAYTLIEGQQYFWRVTAKDAAGGQRTASANFSFRLADHYGPAAALLKYPRSGDVISNNTPGLVWQSASDPSGVTSYTVQVSDDALFANIVVQVNLVGTDTGLQLASPLPRATNYYWRVMATDTLGNSSTSAASVFGVDSKHVSYTLEVATDLAMTTVVRSWTNLVDVRFDTPLNDFFAKNIQYYWRVNATGVLGRQTVSNQIFSFTIVNVLDPVIGGLLGNYHDGVDLNDPRFKRVDPVINFPAAADGNVFGDFSTGIGGDTFSARWQGWVLADFAEIYTFYVTSDEGQRLWVDGQLLVDDWVLHGATERQAQITLTTGWHPIVYEMFENLGGAAAVVEYASASTTRQVIPASHLGIANNPADNQAPQIVAVYVADAAPGLATVHVVTDEPCSLQVWYGANSTYGQTQSQSALNFVHDIVLPQTPQGVFHYLATVHDMNNNVTSSNDLAACTPTLAQLTVGSLRAGYYRDTILSDRRLSRLENQLNFTGTGGATAAAVGTENYSVRWRGVFNVTTAGDHVFGATSDDGQRLYVNGIRVVDDWQSHLATTRSVTVAQMALGWHPLRYEMYQLTGSARGLLQVKTPNDVAPGPLNAAHLAAVDEAYYAPTLPAISGVVREAVSPFGTPVALTTPTASDCRDPSPVVSGNAPASFPLGSNAVTWTATNRFGEQNTQAQLVTIVDTTPPVVNAGADLTLACDSPLGDGFTPIGRARLNIPTITDNGDINPIWWDDAPLQLQVGAPITITVTAEDSSGNQSTDTYAVTVVNTGSLGVAAGPDLVVPRADNCALPGGGVGTQVSLRIPAITGLCDNAVTPTVTHDYPVAGTTSNVVCIAVGAATQITWSAVAGASSGTDSLFVAAIDTNFDIQIDNATQGWTNTKGIVDASIVNGSFTAPLTWNVNADRSQTAMSQVDAQGTVHFEFGAEAIYCPLNIIVTDAVGLQGATVQPCFGVDKAAPLSSLQLSKVWLDPVDVETTIPVNPIDESSYPHYFTGENLNLTQTASDINGLVASGLNSVLVQLTPITPTGAVADLAQTTSFPQVGFPVAGPVARLLSGCTDVMRCVANQLDFGVLGRGTYRLDVRVSDVAGNISDQSFYLKVVDYQDAAVASVAWLNGLLGVYPDTNGDLANAHQKIDAASRLVLVSPGHAFMMSKAAWDSLLNASFDGVMGSLFLMNYLPRAVKSDTRRYMEETQARNEPPWDLFAGATAYLQSPHSLGAFVITPADRLAAARLLVDSADLSYLQGPQSLLNYLSSMDDAMLAFRELALLYDSRVYSSLFGLPIAYVGTPATVTAGFYANATIAADDTARYIVETIDRQIADIQNDPGVPVVVRTPLGRVKNNIATYKQGIIDMTTTATFNNYRLVTEIYMTANQALNEMVGIQANAFDTYYWKTGVALALAYAMHFSVYQGQTAITTIADRTTDDLVSVAECRFNKAVRDLSNGDVELAIGWFQESSCLIVDLYNKYYGGGQILPADQCIDPATYQCPVLAGQQYAGGCAVVDQAAVVAAGGLPWDKISDCTYP